MVVCDDKNGGCDGGEQSVAQGDDDYLLPPTNTQRFTVTAETPLRVKRRGRPRRGWVLDRCGNDPSAGSPTDTLLRLHLPLNGKV